MSFTTDKMLEHAGVKGMKWGVRKDRLNSSTSRRVDPRKLSDDQLRAAISRMNMEKQYRDLSKNQGVKIGEDAIKNLAKDLAKTTLSAAAAAISTIAVAKFMQARQKEE